MRELPEGWAKQNLVACLEKIIDYRGRTPKKSVNGIVTLSAKSVKMGRIDYSKAYYISKETYKSFMVRGFPKKGDILMTTEAPLGCIAKLDRDNISVAQRLLTLRGKAGVLDNDYLMYFLTSRRGQHELHSRASGSTVQGIKRSEFEHVKVLLPSSYEEQKTIAKILSSFDDKIELLRKQNETLESLAFTIFKEWFVNFNYPEATGEMVDSELGEIPKGWQVSSLSDIFKLTGGGTPKTSVKKYWEGNLPWYSVTDAPNSSNCFVINTEKNISAAGLENSSTKLLRKGTTIVSARGTVGKLALVGRKMAMNQSCYGLNGKVGFGDYYVFFQMKEMINHIKKNVHGAVFDTITKVTFEHIKIPTASYPELDKFESVVTPVMDKVLNNVHQIQTLSKARDTLLPKLMSGEIRAEGFGQ